MEERVLVESTHYGLRKKSVLIICVIAFVLATLAAGISVALMYSDYNEEYHSYYDYSSKKQVEYQDTSTVFPRCEHSYERKKISSKTKWVPKENYTYADFKEEHPSVLSYANCSGALTEEITLIYLGGAGITAGLLLVLGILTFFLRAAKIKVTNMFVYGQVFQKLVILPVDSITAFATNWFGTIAVRTPGGAIHVALIRNQAEIAKVLKQLLMERQGAVPVIVEPVAEEVPADPVVETAEEAVDPVEA